MRRRISMIDWDWAGTFSELYRKRAADEEWLKFGLEIQSVNDGDSHDFSYQNNLGGLNISLAYKDLQFGNVEIPNGAVIHYEEEHEGEEEHDDHGEEEHHEGFILANYLQQDAECDGYDMEIGKTFELARGALTLSLGKDSVSGQFTNGKNIPRITPERY